MGRYAIIENNIVTNIIEWDGNTTTWTPPTGSVQVALAATGIADGVGIGQSYFESTIVVPQPVDLRTTSDHYKQLRMKRNKKLSDSDWTQYPDSPLDSTKKAEWSTYRQELRDLPANVTDSNVKDIAYKASHSSWPTKPS
tara:strand:+ start:1922 stop:2341 length:420 start_codon:yes stop_codon:yes gene_type:complete